MMRLPRAKVPLLLHSTAVLSLLVSLGCTSEVGGGSYAAPPPGAGGDQAVTGDTSGADASGGSAPSSTSSSGSGAGNGSGSGSGGSSSDTGTGAGSTSGGDDGPDLTPVFSCNDSEVPDSVPLKRLSYEQYKHTLEDLIGLSLPESREAALAELEPVLDRLPRDTRQGPDTAFAWFSRLDQTVQQSHVDEQYALSNAMAATLTSSDERLVEFVGECAIESSDAQCLSDFIRRFGELAQRRPLADEDVEFYARGALEEPYVAADYADVAALLLASPYVMYTVEHGQDTSDARAPLSAYELASKLSYQFWQTMPDAGLFEAARSGDLLTEAGFEAELDRVLDDEKAERGIGEFFGQWLENPFLEDFDVRAGEDVYEAFLDGFAASGELKSHMLEEVVTASLYSIREGQTFAEFFQSDRSFAVTDDLAAIYGVAPWTGAEPPAFGDAEREGLLARAAFLATGLSDTRPIIKGVLIRKAILCDSVDPPPAEVANEPPPVSDGAVSTREAVEGKTGTAVCQSCHSRLNDLGFVTENFDALGRFRSEQRLFDEAGNSIGTVPVDTTAVPQVEADDATEVTGIAGLNRAILESDKPYACFARQYFRFTNSRVENTAQDGCALSMLKNTLTQSGSLRDALRAIALERSFKEHTF